MTTLAEEVGQSIATITRWRDGDVESFKLSSLVKIFELAELSMDEAFGLITSVSQPSAEPVTDTERQKYEAEITRRDRMIDRLLDISQQSDMPRATQPEDVEEPYPEDMDPLRQCEADSDEARSDMSDVFHESMTEAEIAVEALRAKEKKRDKRTG